jgi:hypothetical protein
MGLSMKNAGLVPAFFLGSSRLSGEGRLDFQKKVF